MENNPSQEAINKHRRETVAEKIYVGLAVHTIGARGVRSALTLEEIRINAAASFEAADVFIQESQKQNK